MSPRRLLHVARETLRAAFRSRLVVALVVLLALVLVVLPRAVGGGGSVEEIRRLALTWSLGLSAIVLSVTTLWTGCGAISGEVEERTWPSLSVTSASAFELWLGKWAGLVALNAAFLAPVLAGVAVQVRARGVPAADLQPFERIDPAPESIRAQAKLYFDDLVARGVVKPDAEHTPEAWVDSIYHDLVTSPLSLSAGHAFAWEFPLPDYAGRALPADSAYLSLTLVSPFGSAAEIAGTLKAVFPDGTVAASREIAPNDDRELRLPLPSAALSDAPAGTRSIRLLFENTGAPEAPAALFHPSEDAALFLPHGSFAGNLVRSGLVLLALLATLAALGTACGSLFSRPVAIFTATCLAILGVISHSNLSDQGVGCCDDPVAAEQPGHAHAVRARRVLDAIATLTAPVDAAAPLDRAGDGLLVPARHVRNALLLDGVALPVVLGLLSALLLRRRDEA